MTRRNGSRPTARAAISGTGRASRAVPVVVALGTAAALGLLIGRGGAEARSGAPVEVLGRAVDGETLRLGQDLYAANCAACHGTNLEGQPDWKDRGPDGRMPAPPHDASGHTWHHSDQDLLLIIREGLAAVVPGYQSDMPAFGELLSEAETEAVLAYIKSTWPERERAFQAEATRSDG